jgi:hypothetical protein
VFARALTGNQNGCTVIAQTFYTGQNHGQTLARGAAGYLFVSEHEGFMDDDLDRGDMH